MKIPLITSGSTIHLDKFWISALIYHDRPNLLNKKLSGMIQSHFYEFHAEKIKDVTELLTYSAIIYEARKLSELTNDSLQNLIIDILLPHDKNLKLHEIDRSHFSSTTNKIFLSLRVLIPKNSANKKCVEIVVIDPNKYKLTFFAVQEKGNNLIAPGFPYHFEWLNSGHIRIAVDNFEDADTANAEWLVDKVFPKIISWASNELVDKSEVSLSSICLEKYVELYQKLKMKYGKAMTEVRYFKFKYDNI